jgi:hypothetical protein
MNSSDPIIIDDSTDDETQSLPAEDDFMTTVMFNLDALARSFGAQSYDELKATFPYHKYGIARKHRVSGITKVFDKKHFVRTHDSVYALTVKVAFLYDHHGRLEDTLLFATPQVASVLTTTVDFGED